MSDVFVSYKTEDRPRAAQVVAALQAQGLSVWWDQHIEPGTHWRETITQSLMSARCVVVLWTKASVAAGGRFVHDEASLAQRRGVYLPVRLDEVDPPLGFGQHQSISLIGWRGALGTPAFAILLAAVQAMVGVEPPQQVAQRFMLPPSRQDRRLLIGGGIASLAVIAGAAGVFLAPTGLRCVVGFCPPAGGPSSIVVLPFRNLSGDGRHDYLCEGVSEQLRGALSRLGSIQVLGRTSSDAFKDANGGTAAVAAKLGVSYILDGSVRISGKKLRVSAQLIDAKSGLERWSDDFDRGMTDIISVQTDIAASVAASVQGQLVSAQVALVSRPATSVPAAYDALLRGGQVYRRASTEVEYREALRLFDLAIAADPTCAEAHAKRALVLRLVAGQFTTSDHLRSANDAAVAAAERAVQLAPGSGYAQSILGYALLFGRLDFAGARAAYQRSIQLAPNDQSVVGSYGQFAAVDGQAVASLSNLAKAVTLDPLNPKIYLTQAVALYFARRFGEAIESARRGLLLNPTMSVAHATIGDARLAMKDTAAALSEYEQEPLPMFRLTGQAIVRHRIGDRKGAAEALHGLLTQLGDSAAYQQAQVRAQWGDADAAFASLNRAFEVGDSGLTYLQVDPLMDPIRTDRRFPDQLRRLNLT